VCIRIPAVRGKVKVGTVGVNLARSTSRDTRFCVDRRSFADSPKLRQLLPNLGRQCFLANSAGTRLSSTTATFCSSSCDSQNQTRPRCDGLRSAIPNVLAAASPGFSLNRAPTPWELRNKIILACWRAKSYISTWTHFMRPWSNGIILSCGASLSSSRGAAIAP